MDENQKNNEISAEDKEYEEIKKKTPGLNEEKPEAPEPKEEPEEKEEEPEKKEEKKPESEKKQDDSEDEEDEDIEDPQPKRPEKYIPVKQYTDEKKKWRESEEDYKKRIADLEKIANTSDRGSKISDDKIKVYAEKHGITIEVAKSELERVRDAQELLNGDDKIPSKKENQLDEETKTRIEKAEIIEAEQMFNKEFEDLAMPEIKQYWPNASEKQIKEAKALIEKKATTKQFIHSDLDYVVFKSQKELGAIFDRKKGPEDSTRAADKGDTEYRASDFKDGKTSFAVLSELDSEKLDKIVQGMDIPTYEKYCRWIEQNDVLQINRGGKRIKT